MPRAKASGPRALPGGLNDTGGRALGELCRRPASGRRAYTRRAWGEAWESLSLAARTTPLGAEDVELLGTSAYMLGRGDDLESLSGRITSTSMPEAPARLGARSGWV